ncbi:Sensor protein VraS [Polaribacter huanghezhanensis]|uniref:tetratricopeptide repeat-containing sensor histidine kinase n=1 Tax=Polaribacter huanghezhanensis TaxID=1354726 RepID=UPI0026479ED8|nr:tetratricopeptide repeat-containing sensor histidine kinase [Polaribacter huanghezhanensis]WKD86025.1 Sensor protein VraS [Polaribacter huanghezhanensis]
MSKTIERLFLLGILFFFNFQSKANPSTKGETRLKPVFPLVVLQEKDTTYLQEYQLIKQLYEKEDFTTALKLALHLDTSLEQKNSVEIKYANTFLIGKIFKKRNLHQKALIYYKKALYLLTENEHFKDNKPFFLDKSFEREKKIANTLLNIGSEYYKLNKKDSAAIYFKKIIDISSLNDFPDIKASGYTNLSAIQLEKENFVLAKEYALKAVEIYKSNSNKLSEASALNNLANIYLVEKNYAKAKEIYTKAIGLIKNDKSIVAIKNKEDLYYNLAYILYMQKDYKAYEYLDQSFVFKDTLTAREFKRIVKGVYAEYEEQYKVELVKNQVALKKAEEKKTAWFFGILSLLIIIISGVVIYNYKLRQKNLKLHLDQTKLSQESKLEKLKSDSQVRILNATLDGKEAERKQIAETLHDSVSSLLSSANLHLQASKMQFKEKAPLEIDKTQKIIIEASQTIRDLSHTLVSSVLLKFGLKYAIKDMAEKYSNSKIEIKTTIKNVRRYQQSFEIKANNIIQELVNNILKHSNATKATVQMEDKKGILFVDIQDDGEGFDKTEIAKKDGLGINQIEARIQMMKGRFRIDSNSQTGTRIKIELPILEKKETSRA